jgi:hypothetical protein
MYVAEVLHVATLAGAGGRRMRRRSLVSTCMRISKHKGAQLHAQQLLAACEDGRAGATIACGTIVACGASLAACVVGETGAAGGANAGVQTSRH